MRLIMAKHTKLFFVLLSCVFLILTGISTAAAQGKFIVKPTIEAGYEYDDNYYRAENDEVSVNTYYVKPGIVLGYFTAKTKIMADYYLTANWYSGENKIDDDDYVGHQFDFIAQCNVTDRFTASLYESFLYTRDSASSDIYDNRLSRDKYAINQISPEVAYNFGDKFTAKAKYTNRMLDWKEGEAYNEDSDEDRGTFDLIYNLNKTLSLDLNYQYWQHDYDRTTSDYESNQFQVILSKDAKHLTYSIGAGYHDRKFDKDGVEDFDDFIWMAKLEAQSEVDTDNPTSYMSLGLSSNFNDFGDGEEYYKAIRFDALASHIFIDKIKGTLKFNYQNSDYENSDREDDKWEVSARADYLITDRFSIGIEPGYEDRDSNQAGRDYSNTYFLVSGKFDFDLGSR